MGELTYKLVEIEGEPVSIALEAEYWAALVDFCRREGVSLKQLCGTIYAHRGDSDLQTALRRFALDYNQEAADKSPKGMADESDAETSAAFAAAMRSITKH
jgi:predicted DNA-binding ribbon-helix-helix protein